MACTSQLTRAGDMSVFPAKSTARTSSVCSPGLKPLRWSDDAHGNHPWLLSRLRGEDPASLRTVVGSPTVDEDATPELLLLLLMLLLIDDDDDDDDDDSIVRRQRKDASPLIAPPTSDSAVAPVRRDTYVDDDESFDTYPNVARLSHCCQRSFSATPLLPRCPKLSSKRCGSGGAATSAGLAPTPPPPPPRLPPSWLTSLPPCSHYYCRQEAFAAPEGEAGIQYLRIAAALAEWPFVAIGHLPQVLEVLRITPLS